MRNMSTTSLTDDQRAFIDDLAALLSVWAMPGNSARLYGYLQLRNAPASLDDIARDLEISKTNAFTAAKVLEDHGNARRLGERGTKRIYFIAGDDPGMPLRRQADAFGKMSALLEARKDAVTEGPAAQRIARLAAFHKGLQTAMDGVIRPLGEE